MQPRERLTAKEMQVALLVWQGLTNREIALAIGTTEQVVKNYLRNTFDKLGVWSRLELARRSTSPAMVAWLNRHKPLDPHRLGWPANWRAVSGLTPRGLTGFSTTCSQLHS